MRPEGWKKLGWRGPRTPALGHTDGRGVEWVGKSLCQDALISTLAFHVGKGPSLKSSSD